MDYIERPTALALFDGKTKAQGRAIVRRAKAKAEKLRQDAHKAATNAQRILYAFEHLYR